VSEIEFRTTQVDLSGLMTVLGDHLYSTPTVALRELVQNAHDAITRRRMESEAVFDPRILVRADRDRGTLSILDNGAGLTRDEVIAFLATVGAGYTRTLRQKTASDDLIGYFGLGFLSAFVVSERIEVRTTSYQSPHEGWLYRSRDGERYSLEPCEPGPVGSVVELTLKERFRPLLEGDELRALLERYCALLSLPVFLGQDPVAVNAVAPPWRDESLAGTALTAARKAFAARFERRFEPLCVMAIEPTAECDVRGLLWVQDARTYGTSDNRNLAVFVRGMLLDDDARELLPSWAGFVGGVIESSTLTPTASREDLQRDDRWKAAHAHIVRALIEGLAKVASSEPESWRRVLLRHNEALLGCALCDERLMDLLANELTVPTSEGDLTARVVFRRGDSKAYVSLGTRGGFEEMLFRALKTPIAAGTRYGVLPFLRAYAERKGGAVVELGTEEGNRHVFKSAPLAADERAWLESLLLRPGQRLVAARFAPEDLPLVLVPDRDAELKARIESDEADKRIGAAALKLARIYTKTLDGSVQADLYVNVDSPAIRALVAGRDRGAAACEPAARLLRSLVALMAGWNEGSGKVDLQSALSDFTQTACALLR
jgi:molecular chaperone HtpG